MDTAVAADDFPFLFDAPTSLPLRRYSLTLHGVEKRVSLFRFAMKRLLLLFCVLVSPVLAQRTYVPASDYLRTPSLAINYVDSCARFWTNVYDPALGGYWTNVDSMGHVITAWGTNKNMMSQTRDAMHSRVPSS